MKLIALALLVVLATTPRLAVAQVPSPPGLMVNIGGGQRIHLHCTGAGSPTVVFEGGSGDFSVIWSLVQPKVSRFTRACSYDRAGFAWSDPGAQPRTFGQMALELRTALRNARISGPFVLVGQSFGGALVRGFAAQYPRDVVGMVLVDAIHEDGFVFYGGQPHHLREERQGLTPPAPRIALDTALLHRAATMAPLAPDSLEDPLSRMSPAAQQIWRWASVQPVYRLAQPIEMSWSADEAEKNYQRRQQEPASLKNMPLIVLARTAGEFRAGMRISPDSLERLRRAQQADLAKLSTRGELRFAPHAGHNIHLEDPDFVTRAIRDLVSAIRR